MIKINIHSNIHEVQVQIHFLRQSSYFLINLFFWIKTFFFISSMFFKEKIL
jgi:hypothetical protein